MVSADVSTVAAWTAAACRAATPLAFVMLGETLTERVGVINLGVEGQMLMGACAGFAGAATLASPWWGLVVGAVAGLLLSTVHAALCLGAKANQIGSGLAVWMLGLGLTSYFGRAYVGAAVKPLPPLAGPGALAVPFAGELLTQLTASAPLALGAALLAGLWLFRTRSGLRWRAVGESLDAARAAGIRPYLVQVLGILVGGALSGLGGAVLSVDYTQTWAQDMTKGRGLVAVGLVIVARWNPYLIIPVAVVFGLAESSALRLQAAGVAISSHLLATVPYLVAIAVVVATHYRARQDIGMPASLRGIFKD